jgi:hypothetical protein
MKEAKEGGSCNMHDARFQSNIFKRKHHFEDLVVEVRIILSWFLDK